jgi:ATP-dependent DNA helicase MPH1
MVATSIGEEGLDIGEIDLIVCYEASKSPIRMVGLSPNSLLQSLA